MDFCIKPRITRRVGYYLVYLCLLFSLSSCGIFRVMPIQLARVTQTETYTQVFTFMDDAPNSSAVIDNQDEPNYLALRQNEKIDRVFTSCWGNRTGRILKTCMVSLPCVRSLSTTKSNCQAT